MILQQFPEIVEVFQRAGDTVDLVRDNCVNLALSEIADEALESRAMHVFARVPAVFVNLGDLPTVFPMKVDVRHTQLALAVQ
ncbi:MAG: hypothetical protein FIB00_04145 [Chloroflexi bacterium]|nr:hypothetical protein [Chloroflexota bacterium]